MTNKDLLENIIIDCEYLGKDKATIDTETIKSIEKDLEKLELYEKVFSKMQEDGAYYKGQYYKQQEILDILKDNAKLYVNDVNKYVKCIQINITTCDDKFEKVEEWLEDEE